MNKQAIYYKTLQVNGISIFYREAGDKTKPQIILLNGLPNASSAFQELIYDLKDKFYLVAPDFPGFGNSDIPPKNTFDYTFHSISLIMEQFIDKLGLTHPNVYALGYGGPVTFRIALRRPDLFAQYILQNSNAYEAGLGPAMRKAAPYLANRNEETLKLVKPLVTLDGIKLFFLQGAKEVTRINPDGYLHALYNLSRPGQEALQLDLLYDYRTNIEEYPTWQKFLQEAQPRLLLVWGKNDVFFPLSAAEAIKNDVPSAELHVYDTGHLALEEHHTDIAERIRDFLNK